MDESAREEYFLRVVKVGEAPDWPVPEENLVVGKQELGDDLVQYWAYPKDSGREASDLPPAEVVAAEQKSGNPAIMIDRGRSEDPKSEGYLELYLVRDGHAYARNSSNLDNLEDNISAILDFAKNEFNIKVGHFMTTTRVPKEAEEKLDNLENGDIANRKVDVEDEQKSPFRPASVGVGAVKGYSKSSSNFLVFLPILVVLGIAAGLIFFKGDAISSKILPKIPFLAPAPTLTPTPIPSPTPTPTPSIDRSEFKIRVLNGTTTTGAAGKLLEVLKEKGWGTLSAGNAKNQAIEQTIVAGKEGMEEVVKVLIADLAPDLEATQSSTPLKSTDKADLEVVIGKK
ncbi:MAG: hypothetical protein UU67_C0013G0007 [Candidatus Daviesbacteria bacterium GW2011_GWB1_41_5]|uniref:LytR/CpsA/Psr regulator C-terminal domain-containing protein n=2 Tax=Patescibacteria group TaxID=1783273 RepID=A0A0G0WM83_9BACT|nr:MAG: hypothetical protein UU67_C0013G0007 [Candidatus Daviesbacteria bacterium GW2011_GWB1_41_5]KKT81099.1 MAG: hypothetical protein UW78_C0017G0005 [Candidatus Azambacteria bacterium GW2011_GWA1_44_9]